jgi:hypothetical protein
MRCVCQCFKGPLSFKSAAGFIEGHVAMQQWQIGNQQTAEIPHEGLLIVHLRAGALVSEIEGEEKTKRREDSFWSVPAGRRLIVYTARDSALLQTVDFMMQ